MTGNIPINPFIIMWTSCSIFPSGLCLRRKDMLISSRMHTYGCGGFPIPTFLRDSDEAPAGGEGSVIHAVGGAELCAQRRREKPRQDRRFWSGDMKLISRHWRGWLSRCCCHLHAVIRLGSWWCHHRRGGVQRKPWSRLNKLSPLWWCSSVACGDSRNYEPPEQEGRLFGLLGGETLPAASGVWKTRTGSLSWKHHLVLKARQQAETQGTESYLASFFFFFWP